VGTWTNARVDALMLCASSRAWDTALWSTPRRGQRAYHASLDGASVCWRTIVNLIITILDEDSRVLLATGYRGPVWPSSCAWQAAGRGARRLRQTAGVELSAQWCKG